LANTVYGPGGEQNALVSKAATSGHEALLKGDEPCVMKFSTENAQKGKAINGRRSKTLKLERGRMKKPFDELGGERPPHCGNKKESRV